ncbi:hypothetical protein OS122_23760 [Mycolicibacterium mucogenicum]|uniref:CDGP domain-containing protein n=1 Tax=Mycolicibacterium mucogenicum TaxID=56689 RepID=UPI002269EEE4|nr:hypothetical protein [Mycolicibacterium mucogenicum]MCX8563918.1 hypothetical protein [Mycolicibacterium mucogenicum]
MNRLASTAILIAAMTAITTVNPTFARADVPANCEVRPWGFFMSRTRIICDGPIRADGSWSRERFIGIPRHYANPSSSCSGGQYYSNCTFYPGGWVNTQTDSQETYDVRPDNVLPDEPGHLPG